MCLRLCALAAALRPVPGMAQSSADAPPAGAVRQSLDDAWWTGPLLAASAGTLPPGHFLVEPYLYDVVGPHSNGFGSRTFIMYGLVDRLAVGLIPTFGYNKMNEGLNSSGVGLGDLTALAQYGLTRFHPGGWIPATSVVVQETFPTGAYDRLGDRPSDGLGGGAYTTTVALYSQSYLWMPNGRILRVRLDVSEAFSSTANLEGVSVYGTGPEFRGHATPGPSLFVNPAGEYSLTRNWVLALDLSYGHNGNTVVRGSGIRLNSGPSDAFGFAPGVEYNWTPKVGVILGARVIAGGHNTPFTITPAVAVNIVI